MKVLLKDDFNKLSIKEQIEYINTLLQEGYTITKACSEMNVARSTISRRFKKANYKYNKEKNIYILSNTKVIPHSNTKVLHESNRESIKHKEIQCNKGIEVSQNNSNTKVVQKLDELVNVLCDLVKCHKSITKIEKGKLQIDKNLLNGEVKRQSIKCDSYIYGKFSEFCEDNKEYKKQDLISLALLEFMKKYKK